MPTFLHDRQSIRLKGYDYSRAGTYFITVCSWQRECLFGNIVDGNMLPNDRGIIVEKTWMNLADRYPMLRLDEFVVMPNHFHGILYLSASGTQPSINQPYGLSEIIRSFKSISSRRINLIQVTVGNPVWQRNYYDRIIRNDSELDHVRKYIINNPSQWALDQNNPSRNRP